MERKLHTYTHTQRGIHTGAACHATVPKFMEKTLKFENGPVKKIKRTYKEDFSIRYET